MITPTRFGLKYAPVPTLALEYEDDLSGVEGAGATSLYVFRENESRRRVKKLHVVELPMLTKASETRRILEQLQRDNSKFLSPSVVNESQLKRLLDLLVERLEAVGGASDPMPQSVAAPISTTDSQERAHAPEEEDNEEEQAEIDESFIEESMAESSQALESSGAPSDHQPASLPVDQPPAVQAPNMGTFLSQEDAESEDEQEVAVGEGEDESEADKSPARGERDGIDDYDDEQYDSPDKATATSNAQALQSAAAAADDMEKQHDEEDDEKKKALKSGSEVSEEDIQSEELEYFSEDGSDEDSF